MNDECWGGVTNGKNEYLGESNTPTQLILWYCDCFEILHNISRYFQNIPVLFEFFKNLTLHMFLIERNSLIVFQLSVKFWKGYWPASGHIFEKWIIPLRESIKFPSRGHTSNHFRQKCILVLVLSSSNIMLVLGSTYFHFYRIISFSKYIFLF